MTDTSIESLNSPSEQILGMSLDWQPDPSTYALAQALAYWTKLAGTRLPKRADLAPRDMLAFLPFVQLYQLDPAGINFKIRLMGTGVRPLFERDLTGECIVRPAPDATDSVALLNRRMFAIFDAIQSRPKPMLASVPRTVIEKLHGQPLATLFMPLSSDGTSVDMILAVTDVPNSTKPN